jgi:RND family efflux transporter MFP subunit
MFHLLRKPIPAAVVVAVVTAAGGLVLGRSSCSERAARAQATDARKSGPGESTELPVPSVPATPAAMDDGFLGVVLARTSADIAPRFEGCLAKVNVRVGDTVARGTVLATLAVPTLAYDLRVAEAELRAADLDVERASTELSQATERFARKQRLDGEHLATADEVTGADYQTRLAKTHVSASRALASEHRAQVERLQQDKDDTRIVAPFDGVVAARYADPGMTVRSLVPIVRLITMNDLLVRFAVLQTDVAHLSIGNHVHVRTSETHRDLQGTVERVASEVEPASHMIFVEAQVDASDASGAVLSGELARVTLVPGAP